MKINHSLDLTDTDRARVRAAIGRGGLATRKEIRIFVDRAIRAAIASTPDPKPRRQKVAAAPGPFDQLHALPDETCCIRCERPKSDHGRMSLTCPPRPGRAKGQRFTPAGAR
jgi:hypothetical protein